MSSPNPRRATMARPSSMGGTGLSAAIAAITAAPPPPPNPAALFAELDDGALRAAVEALLEKERQVAALEVLARLPPSARGAAGVTIPPPRSIVPAAAAAAAGAGAAGRGSSSLGIPLSSVAGAAVPAAVTFAPATAGATAGAATGKRQARLVPDVMTRSAASRAALAGLHRVPSAGYQVEPPPPELCEALYPRPGELEACRLFADDAPPPPPPGAGGAAATTSSTSSTVIRAAGLPLPLPVVALLCDRRSGKAGLDLSGVGLSDDATAEALSSLATSLAAGTAPAAGATAATTAAAAVAGRPSSPSSRPASPTSPARRPAGSSGRASPSPPPAGKASATAAAAGGVAGSTSVPLRLLDLSWNRMGRGGGAAVIDVMRRLGGSLAAMCIEGSDFGGVPAGVGAVMEAVARGPAVRHLGLSIDEARVQAAAAALAATAAAAAGAAAAAAAGATADGAAGRGGRGGRSASAAAAPARGGGTAARGGGRGGGRGGKAGGSGGDAKAADAPTYLPGTASHLVHLLRTQATAVTSLSLAGSNMPRRALAQVLASFSDAPDEASLAALAAANAAAAAAPAPAPAGAVRGRGGGRGGSSAAKGAAAVDPVAAAGKAAAAAIRRAAARTPLLGLSLARCYVGAAGVTDVAVAMSDPAASSGVGALAAATGLGAGTSVGVLPGVSRAGGGGGGGGRALPVTATASDPFDPARSPPIHNLPGSLRRLQYVNLSQCALSTAALAPLLAVVAGEASCLAVLCLRGNFIDDAGAGVLATALAANARRLAAAAAAQDWDAAPIRSLGGGDGGGGGGGGAAAPLPLSPLRVLDLRNNPLYLSPNPADHPGCRALVDVFSATPTLLTLTGPDPTPEGLLAWSPPPRAAPPPPPQPASDGGEAAAAPAEALAPPRLTNPGVPRVGLGCGSLIDLLAVRAAARNVRLGSGASGTLDDGADGSAAGAEAGLHLPHAMAHAVAALTESRVLAAACELVAGGTSGVDASSPLMQLLAPPLWAGEEVVHAPLPPTRSDAGEVYALVAALSREAGSRYYAHADVVDTSLLLSPAAAFGAPLLTATVPPPSHRAGAPLWFEWVASFRVAVAAAAVPGGLAGTLRDCGIVWFVTAAPAGQPHSSAGVLLGATRTDFASRDRLHARSRAPLGLSFQAPGGAGAADWHHADGMLTPSVVLSGDGVDGGAEGKGEGSGVALLAWQPGWHCVALPATALADGEPMTLRLHARLARLTAGGGPGSRADEAALATAMRAVTVQVTQVEVRSERIMPLDELLSHLGDAPAPTCATLSSFTF